MNIEQNALRLPKRFTYNNPSDIQEILVNELVKILGILVGLGSGPILEKRLEDYWIVSGLTGLLVAGVSCAYIIRRIIHNKRQHSLSGAISNRPKWYKRILEGATRFWVQLRNRLFFWRRNQEIRPESDSGGTRDDEAEPGEEGRDDSDTLKTVESVVLLPWFNLFIGIFILIPAIVVWRVGYDDLLKVDMLLAYFSAPAVLLWLAGEFFYIFPKVFIKPKYAPTIAGIAKGIFSAASALLLWIYLGLSISVENLAWMPVAALAIGLVGALLGLQADQGESRTEHPQSREMSGNTSMETA